MTLRSFFVLMSALFLLATAAAAASDPSYDEIRAARPDGRTVQVSGLTLTRDAYTFRFDSGTFHFLAPAGGTTFGAVFLGQGAWELEPATESERRHLAFVTGKPDLTRLDDRFTELVLLFSDGTAAEIEAGGTAAEQAADARATAAWESYLERQRRKYQTNLHLRVLLDLLNRPGRKDGVFLAPVDGERLAPALISVDPLGISTVAAKFTPFGGEEVAFFSTDDQDDGFWYLSGRKGEAVEGRGKPAYSFADAERYAIDTTIDGARIEAQATIRFRPRVDGIRVLPIRILPKLRIASAVQLTASGEVPLGIVQEDVELGRMERLFRAEVADADAAVVFPRALARGEVTEIRLAYGGRDVIQSTGEGYAVGARDSWYPNLEPFTDPAIYDLTFRFPRRNTLVAVGRLVEEREEGNQRVAHWTSEVPIRVAGFNYGDFRKISQTDEASGLSFDVYTDRKWTKKAGDIMADAVNTGRVGSSFFGKPPLPQISITQQVEWFFGQSWPSLVFLPTVALTTSAERVFGFEGAGPQQLATLNEFAKTVPWHEVAHQWWGHGVGWQSYRDQWLSEGLSEFTAALVLQFTEGPGKYDAFWEERRRALLSRRGGQIANADAGAISQGFRLASRRAPAAAQAVVYGKGGFVVHMLRSLLHDPRQANPDIRFIAVLREFSAKYAGKNPSTEDFRSVVERHMTPAMDVTGNGSMKWFFDQWVHGTDIPTLSADLRAVPAGDGTYRLTGTVTQKDVPEGFHSVIPLYIELDGDRLIRTGTIRVTGPRTETIDAQLSLPGAPRRVRINAMHDVLTR